MLQIRNLTINAGDKEIIKDFNLEVKTGEIHVLMGPNGAGKSTVCRSILHDPNYTQIDGDIIYKDTNLNSLDTSEISKLGIQMITQSPIAIEGVTNVEMLRMALAARTGESVDIFKFAKELKEVCEKIDLPESFLHRDINSGMSGGERKKNELLHVWMLKPSFLILDEVDSGLDVDALKVVANSLKEFHDTYSASILMVTHNTRLIEILKPDFVHIVKDKKIVKTGGADLAKEIENLGFLETIKTNEIGGI